MTKSEALKEYEYVIQEFKNLLDKIYKINNYSKNDQCVRVINRIEQRIDADTASYIEQKLYDESYFVRNDLTQFFKSEKHLIKSLSDTIDYLSERIKLGYSY